jgi:hypothetical protein
MHFQQPFQETIRAWRVGAAIVTFDVNPATSAGDQRDEPEENDDTAMMLRELVMVHGGDMMSPFLSPTLRW